MKIAQVATLAHGFTMADVTGLTRKATGLSKRYSWAMDNSDRYEAAWHGIVEYLYAAVEQPSDHDLVWAGVDAVRREVKDTHHHHGYNDSTRRPMAAFGKFWHSVTGDHEDFTAHIVERMALPQILSLLTPDQYEAVAALAANSTSRAAADSLGISAALMSYRLNSARARLIEAWHEGETPRPVVTKAEADLVCKNRHDRSEHSYRDSRGVWICRECKRAASRKSMRKIREAS